jgi:hypothetical protein
VALTCAVFYLLKVLFTFLIFGVWKKEKVDFKVALGKYSYLMIPLTITLLLAYVASYIHTNIVIAILAYGFIHYGLFTYKYYRDNFNVKDTFLMIITPLIIMATMLIGFWLSGQISEMFMPDDMTEIMTMSNPFSSIL